LLELRTFEEPDFDAVWALHDEALEVAGVHGGHGPWEGDLRDIRGTYIETGGDFLVARLDGAAVAMGGLLRRTKSECEIRRMRVRPDCQRQGLGRRLLAALEQRARELGFETVVLDTTEGQIAASRLYESTGYRETGRREAGGFVFVDFVKELEEG
jgi:ribosomal protein S18 acetylase RimI-like enzyme